jgi:hypothetical protein
MVAKLTKLTHKIVIQLHLVTAVPFVVLTPGGQSGNFWIHPHIPGVEEMPLQKLGYVGFIYSF